MTAILSVTDFRKHYESRQGPVRAVERVSFTVDEGEFVSIVGPSGAGKTTVLRAIAGLIPATDGQLTYRGQPIEGPPRDFGVVFQDYARSLFPWFTVASNVALPLRNTIRDATRRRAAVAQALEQVGLSGTEKLHPSQLSGGMQQRVAIARALAYSPRVLIMDEPFASVDAQTRAELEDLVLELRRLTGATVVFVTHDVDEAVYMSDRVIVLSRSPSVVSEIVTTGLPPARDQITTKSRPEFTSGRAQVMRLITTRTPQGEPVEAQPSLT